MSFSRNLKMAFESRFEWLFFLDTDTLAPKLTVPILQAANRDLIGGMYFQRFPPYLPAHATAGVDAKGLIVKQPLPPFTPGDIIPIDFLATGCTLVHRRCMEAMLKTYPKPYEWTLDIDKEGGLSEDFDFSLKAARIGFQPWLHTGVVARHEMLMTVGPRGPEPLAGVLGGA